MYRIALLSDTTAQDVVPSLSLLSHRVQLFPLDTAHKVLEDQGFDLVILDARTALVQARHSAQLLRASGLQLPLIALLNEGGMAAVASSWQVDDIVSDQASPSEMDARLRLAIVSEAEPQDDSTQERIIRAGNLVIDTQAYSAHLSGAALRAASSRARSCSRRSGATIPTTAAPARSTCTCVACDRSWAPSTSR